ncbi:class I SAM-dependent methyltransferase [Desulfogranum mediterraneum]|uniref:class I SAM-dependent methyltransferase n=1 Tax=Desulfogranum mediterraneum TaxID=160661 RepID=UPI000427FA77|nr:methyltransferase domain-containing protein [Desulfogranum mediterraneum]
MKQTTSSKDQQKGWQRKATAYDEISLPATSQAFAPLLDSIGTLRGLRVLELASGTGHLAEQAVARGATVVGVDIAPEMVEKARRRVPAGAEFFQGDGEELSFEEQSFQAVLCSFGFLHFAHPEQGLREAARVLKPGGCCAFTVWQAPEQGNEFFQLIMGAYRTRIKPEPGSPPSLFGLADPEVHRPMLSQAGFTDIHHQELEINWPLNGPETLFEFALKGGVRTRMLYEQQPAAIRQAIRKALISGAQSYLTAGKTAVPCPAVLVRARKP